MAIYNVDIFTEDKYFQNMKNDIIKMLSNDNNYIVNFHPDETDVDIIDSIIINVEYPIIASTLLNLTKDFQNFEYGDFSIDTLNNMNCSIISKVDPLSENI
jgi:hypothetical protein